MPIFGSSTKDNDKKSKDKKTSARSTRSKQTSVSAKSKPTITKRARRRNETYNLYIHRILKRVNPNNGMSKKSMLVMNSFVVDMYTRVSKEAIRLMKAADRSTLTVGDVESAVLILFPGELSTHATEEGSRAVSLFEQN